jgi:hypothetical protein
MGDGLFFSKNLRVSLFNKGLSNEPNFVRIHLLDSPFKGSVDSDNRLTSSMVKHSIWAAS